MGYRLPVKALLALAALVLAVAGVELAAAVHRSFRCPGPAPTFAVPDLRYGWSHPPDTDVRAWACLGPAYEWSVHSRFNSRGLRDREYDYARTPGVPRVLVLGDSVAEAMQVDVQDGFTRRLAAMLEQEGVRAEVLNAGHSGFGTDNSLLFYEEEGMRYAPDVVVLAFNLQNDLAENSSVLVKAMYAGGPGHPKADVRVTADGDLDIDRSAYAAAAEQWQLDPIRSSASWRWWKQRSFLARKIAAALSGGTPATAAPPPVYPAELDVYADPPAPHWREARHTTGALLRRLRRSVESGGSRLLVLVIPSRETVDPAEWKKLEAWFPALAEGRRDLEMPRRWLTDFLVREGFDFVDATEVLRARQAATGRRGYFDFDPHPDRDGQSWIAEACAPSLRRLLPGDP